MPRRATFLHQHPRWEEFFSLAERLAPGDSVEFISSFPGSLGRQEISALRSWISAERKRRIEGVIQAMLADSRIDNSALEQADPLKGVFTGKESVGDRWKLVVARGDWHTVTYTNASGETKVLWEAGVGPVPPPECEYEPESAKGSEHG